MNILVIAGTSDGRDVARALQAQGHRVTVSAATAHGANVCGAGIFVRSGRLDQRGLIKLLLQLRAAALVDASHPFAVRVSEAARGAAAETGLAYLRYKRPPAVFARRSCQPASDIDGAAEMAAAEGRRIFLTTGVNSIGRFLRPRVPAGVDGDRHYFARVLPTEESIAEALKWLAPANLVAAVGPFSREFNEACYRAFSVDTVVTKDSGAGAGVEEKVEAALALGLKVIVVERPIAERDGIMDKSEISAELARLARAMKEQLTR